MTAFGVLGTLIPKRFVPEGDSSEVTPQAVHLTRMWALREAALGSILLGTRQAGHRKHVLLTLGVLAAAESVVNLQTPGLDSRNRIMSAVSPAVCGVASLYAWRTA